MEKTQTPHSWKENSMGLFNDPPTFLHTKSMRVEARSSPGSTVSTQDPHFARLTLFDICSIVCGGIRVCFQPLFISLGLGKLCWGVDSCERLPRVEDTMQREPIHKSNT